MICVKCNEDKDVEDFDRAPRNKSGRQGSCKPCTRAYQKKWNADNRRKTREYAMKREFGISHDEYDAMLEAQGGGCAICGTTSCPSGKLAIDHDHKTGVVRGLLCGNCNRGIGNLRDDPDLLMNAVEYLKRPRS